MTNPALPAGGVGGASPPTLLLKGVGAGTTPAWQPGQRVEAVVVRQLAAAEYLLRVDGALYAADLPGQATPGARLPLLFLGAQGSPRFLLLPADAAPSDTIQLSTAARLLGNLLPGPKPAPLIDVTPLLAAPTGVSRPIAQALQQVLQASGLSYESHVVDWVQGQRPLSALLAEPQGRQSSAPIPPGGAVSAPVPQTATAPGASAAARQMPQGPAGAQPPPLGGPAEPGAQASSTALGTGAPETLPQPLIPVVQQQLAYLTQGVVLWQGVLWPGQQMEWKLQVEDDASASSGQAHERAWTSVLTLDMPRLGRVQARLRLSGQDVRVQISSPRSAPQLAAAQADLQRGIAAAGLALQSFAVDDGAGP